MSGESPLRADRETRLVRIGGHGAELAYDPDAESWYVRASSVPGLRAEAETLEELLDSLPGLIRQASLP